MKNKNDEHIAIEPVLDELAYQKQKWPGHYHSVGEWLLIIENFLNKAKAGWLKGDREALDEVRQVAASGIAAMGMCGVYLRAMPKKKRRKQIVYNAKAKYPSSIKSASA